MKDVSKEIEHVRTRFPKLVLTSKNSITGELDIIDPYTTHLWKTFKIRVDLPNDYPKTIPSTYEVGNNIPKDWHTNPDGSCCLMPKVEQFVILGKNYTLDDYLTKLVIPYFVNRVLVENGQSCVNGEYSHGGRGLMEYYSLRLGTTSKVIIITCLLILSELKEISPDQSCFCNLNVKYKDCHHYEILNTFSHIHSSYFLTDLAIISKSEDVKSLMKLSSMFFN